MPLTVNFSTGQIIGAPSQIIFTDTSTGTDVAVTQRRIFLQQYNASYLVPSGTTTNYIDWPIGMSASITVTVLDADTSLSMTVQWLDVSGAVLYTKTELNVFNMYAKMLDDQLITAQQAYPAIIQNTSYYMNRMLLRLAINDAINSITDMSDITNSQQACDRGMYFVDNQTLFF